MYNIQEFIYKHHAKKYLPKISPKYEACIMDGVTATTLFTVLQTNRNKFIGVHTGSSLILLRPCLREPTICPSVSVMFHFECGTHILRGGGENIKTFLNCLELFPESRKSC